MEMNKHSIDNFVNEVTGSTSDGISEECNIHSAKFLSKNEQVAIQLENKNKNTDIYLNSIRDWYYYYSHYMGIICNIFFGETIKSM